MPFRFDYYVREAPQIIVGTHTSAGCAVSTTLTPPAGATRVMLQAITQNVRYTLDGTVPTATLGFQLKTTDGPRLVEVAEGATLKVIQELATATIQYQWFY